MEIGMVLQKKKKKKKKKKHIEKNSEMLILQDTIDPPTFYIRLHTPGYNKSFLCSCDHAAW